MINRLSLVQHFSNPGTSFTYWWHSIRNYLGFSIMLKDTLTLSQWPGMIRPSSRVGKRPLHPSLTGRDLCQNNSHKSISLFSRVFEIHKSICDFHVFIGSTKIVMIFTVLNFTNCWTYLGPDIRALSLHASCYIKNQLGHCIVQLWMFACVFVCHWLSYKHTVRCGLGNGLAKCNTGIHCFYIVMCVNTLAFGETSFFDIY